MSTYLLFGKYDREALVKVLGMTADERNRKADEIIRRCDGRIVASYATLGEYDVVAVMELPGVEAALKASIELTRTLGISFVSVPALTMEAFDRVISP